MAEKYVTEEDEENKFAIDDKLARPCDLNEGFPNKKTQLIETRELHQLISKLYKIMKNGRMYWNS